MCKKDIIHSIFHERRENYMDQIKIGKFISEKRKEKNITQSKLAEMLYITDRAVSKWERGLFLYI